MLIFDLLPRQHLDKYLKNSLKQIESCLEKSADSFIKNRSYLEAQNLFSSGETTMTRWRERFGNQVKSMAMRMEKMEEERKKKEMEKKENEKGEGKTVEGESKNDGTMVEGETEKNVEKKAEEKVETKKKEVKETKNIGQWGEDVSGVMRKKKTSVSTSETNKWGSQNYSGNGWNDGGKSKRKKGRRKNKGRGHGRNKGTVRKWVETTESIKDREARDFKNNTKSKGKEKLMESKGSNKLPQSNTRENGRTPNGTSNKDNPQANEETILITANQTLLKELALLNLWYSEKDQNGKLDPNATPTQDQSNTQTESKTDQNQKSNTQSTTQDINSSENSAPSKETGSDLLSESGPSEKLSRLSRREALRVGRNDQLISNLRLGRLESEPSQARAGPIEGSGRFILENVEREMNTEICALVENLGETLRPEMLLPIPDDEEILIEDFLMECDVLGIDSQFGVVDELHGVGIIESYFSSKNHSDKILQDLANSAFEKWAVYGTDQPERLKKWLLHASDDHVDLFFKFFNTLNELNPKLFRLGLGMVCSVDPVRLFSIHLMYRFIKKGYEIERPHMDRMLGAWFDYCLEPPEGTDSSLVKSKKNILVGFLNFAVPNGGCELSNLSLKVDKFCSENLELKDLIKMKEAIANQRNAKHKRRKKLAPGFT